MLRRWHVDPALGSHPTTAAAAGGGAAAAGGGGGGGLASAGVGGAIAASPGLGLVLVGGALIAQDILRFGDDEKEEDKRAKAGKKQQEALEQIRAGLIRSASTTSSDVEAFNIAANRFGAGVLGIEGRSRLKYDLGLVHELKAD